MVKESVNNDELNTDIQNGRWFVCYYASWCHYCKDMAEDWERLENKVMEMKLPVNVIKIEQQNITDESIKSYPTIHYVENGKKELYEGERKWDVMYEFLKSKAYCEKCKKFKR